MAVSSSHRVRLRWYRLGYRRCHYCCRQLNYAQGFKNSATVEHIIPKSLGGGKCQGNTLVICSACNRERGNEHFVSFVTRKGFPRQDWLLGKHQTAILLLPKKERLRYG